MKRARTLASVAVAAAGATSRLVSIPDSRPTQVEGSYTIVLRNAPDRCGLVDPQFWRIDNQTTADLVFWQDGTETFGEVRGWAVIGVLLGVGQNKFKGKVDGRNLSARVVGTRREDRSPTCSYTVDLVLRATVEGRELTDGRVDWTPVVSGFGCGELERCQTYQTFTGVRVSDAPPRPDAGI